MNVQTGEIRPWDSLTETQQKSGEWIKLPTHDENGVAMARRDEGYMVKRLFADLPERDRGVLRFLSPARRFDANGKPVP
jgi:hypothetical protein